MPDDPSPGAAVPARIVAEEFERFEGFRETTLAVFTDPAINAALRVVGEALYTMALEYWQHWPREPEGSVRHQARAVLADTRHVQGALGQLGREHEASALRAQDERLSVVCVALAERVREVADDLEELLAPPSEQGGE
jgi:hypothetical protein